MVGKKTLSSNVSYNRSYQQYSHNHRDYHRGLKTFPSAGTPKAGFDPSEKIFWFPNKGRRG
jgi:hypothetical protein